MSRGRYLDSYDLMADILNNGLLSTTEVRELEVVRRKIDIVNNEYLRDPNDPNFEFIQKKFFPWMKGQDVISAVQLHNVWSGIWYSVASVISYFVGNPIGELDLDLTMTIQDLVGAGYGTIPLEKVNNQYTNNYIPAYNYLLRDGTSYVFRFYTQERADNVDVLDYYILRQEYGVGFIKNDLFKFPTLDFTGKWTKVELDTLEQTMWMMDIVQTGLDKPAIWVPSFRDNLEENVSLIDKIRNLIYSIDRNMVMYDQQFLMNTESFILFQNIQPNHVIARNIKDGRKLNFWDVSRVHFSKEQNADIKFVNNKNELIETSIEYEKVKYEKISWITSIPLDFLTGKASSWTIGKGSRSILHGAFIKQIKAYRDLLEPIINDIYETVQRAQPQLSVERTWPDMFAKDENELVAELSTAIKHGLMSQRKAVMKLQNIHDEELDEELELIKQDSLLVLWSNVNEEQGIQTGGSSWEDPEQGEENNVQ